MNTSQCLQRSHNNTLSLPCWKLHNSLGQLCIVRSAHTSHGIPAFLRWPATSNQAAAPSAAGGDVIESSCILINEWVQESQAGLTCLHTHIIQQRENTRCRRRGA